MGINTDSKRSQKLRREAIGLVGENERTNVVKRRSNDSGIHFVYAAPSKSLKDYPTLVFKSSFKTHSHQPNTPIKK